MLANGDTMITAVHVTHEATRKVGGIGAVLEGLITCPAYLQEVERTILVGPLFDYVADKKPSLGPEGKVLYSSFDGVDLGNWRKLLEPVCRKFGVGILYGSRVLRDEWSGRTAEVEVLLFDVANMKRAPLDEFKWKLHERFSVSSDQHEVIWDYEQYVRLALPAFDALRALLAAAPAGPVLVLAHEFMGVPVVLRALLENGANFATAFYAHETATARRIVEEHPAHDTMFYNVISQATKEGLFIEDLFGSQDGFFKHALVKAADSCDSIFAVGHLVRDELHFLSKEFAQKEIDLVPNGIPALEVPKDELDRSRNLLLDYAQELLGWRPTYVFSHVARLVTSKAFWRDIEVLSHLDRKLVEAKESAVLFMLSTEGAVRRSEDVLRIEREYAWPWNHRIGYPDLTGSEIGFNQFLQNFNRRSRAVKVVFVNQFGWDRSLCGERMPQEMSFSDLRKGTDAEFGLSIYEPFGISQFEPLTFGAICLPSSVCGCVHFQRERFRNENHRNIVVGDYLHLPGDGRPTRSLLKLSQEEFDRQADVVSATVADRIFDSLRGLTLESNQDIKETYELTGRLSWDAVVADFFLPAVRKTVQRAGKRSQGE